MKAKVLRTFIDKNTKERYKEGSTIEVNKKRFEEINSTSYGLLVEEIKEVKQVEEESQKKETKKQSTKK